MNLKKKKKSSKIVKEVICTIVTGFTGTKETGL